MAPVKKIFFLLPLIILVVFYFTTKKSALNGSFSRKIIVPESITALDTINLWNLSSTMDGMLISGDRLWLNNRYTINRYDSNKGITSVIAENASGHSPIQQNPIVNFYVDDEKLYWYVANSKRIIELNLENQVRDTIKLNFSFSSFIKLKGKSFLFEENVFGNGGVQLRYVNLDQRKEWVNKTVFSDDEGASMRYSGSWLASLNKNYFFFVPLHDEKIICFDSTGNRKYSLKPIDFRNQYLKIIKEGTRYYLSPEADILRIGTCATKANLYVSSFVRAENQPVAEFKNNLTVDVYNSANGAYLHSFYIPNYKNQQAVDFVIPSPYSLYAAYDGTIIKYDYSKLLSYEK